MRIVRNTAVALILLLFLSAVFVMLGRRDAASIRAKAALISAKAATIQAGDSTNRVQSVLGQPTGRVVASSGILSFDGATEIWSWTSARGILDWHPHRGFPWIVSLNLHIADPNDVVVYFDSTGRVLRVQVPKK